MDNIIKIKGDMASFELDQIKKSHILEHFRDRLGEAENSLKEEIDEVIFDYMDLFSSDINKVLRTMISNIYYWIKETDNFDSGFLESPMSNWIKKYYIASVYRTNGNSLSSIQGFIEKL